MNTKQHEWSFGGRACRCDRAVVTKQMPGVHGVTCPTGVEFISCPSVCIRGFENNEC
jgi:hypothetical protein